MRRRHTLKSNWKTFNRAHFNNVIVSIPKQTVQLDFLRARSSGCYPDDVFTHVEFSNGITSTSTGSVRGRRREGVATDKRVVLSFERTTCRKNATAIRHGHVSQCSLHGRPSRRVPYRSFTRCIDRKTYRRARAYCVKRERAPHDV